MVGTCTIGNHAAIERLRYENVNLSSKGHKKTTSPGASHIPVTMLSIINRQNIVNQGFYKIYSDF